ADGTDAAARAPGVERRALLVGERVGRHVIGRERDRGAEVAFPLGGRLARNPEDEIEADVPEGGGTRRLRGALDVGGIVIPTKGAQVTRVERLRAEREPV